MDENLKKEIDALQERLGYRFEDTNLLIQALTHKSYIHENPSKRQKDNERLEFFGDAVLSLIVSDYCFRRFPDWNEGLLSKLRSAFVSESNLSQIARELQIGNCIFLGKGELQTGGREKNSLLTNTFEAIMGGMYLDGQYEKTYSTLTALLGPKIEAFDQNESCRDYKSELQERVQNLKKAAPAYRLLGEKGPDHAKLFEVEVMIEGGLFGRGMGKSKKESEQMAAKDLLATLPRC